MLRRSRWRVTAGIGVLASTLALSVPAFAAPAGAALLAESATAAGPVSTTPASGTPHLVKSAGGMTENIRQLVKCGTRMYAVGEFTTILQGGKTYTRHNVFSFSATAPYTITSWSPNVNGEVNSIAFTNGHGCGYAYLGGKFTSVSGTTATNIAEVSTTTGSVVSSFERYTNGAVETMFGYRDHLLVGGHFTRTNGYSRYYYESLSPSTGKVDGFINLHIEGQVSPEYPRVIYNQQVSPSGNLLLVEGDFTSVGGQPRQQIFMLNLSGSTAKVTGWTSPDFSKHCASTESFYLRSAAWSPDGSTIYTASTGVHPSNWKKGQFPLWGICDAVASFPATQKSVDRNWVEYSGCDSYYSVAADSGAVYAGGHPRWADNPNACNGKGPGAVPDRGMQGLSLSNGNALLNSRGTAEYYMSRANADDMLITSAGLWIASSNRYSSDNCVGASSHAGICLLPNS